MNSKKVFIFLVLILVLGTWLRLFQLSSLPSGLYPDEAMNGNNALWALENKDFKVFYPENTGREGLFINIQALAVKIFGNEPRALRGVSAIFGVLTILAVYLLTKELFRGTSYDSQKEILGLVAAFFLAVSFWHLVFSRIGFRAIMAPFFISLSSYFLLLLFREDLSQAKKTKFGIIGGLIFGLGFHSYISYRIAPLLLFAPLIFKTKLVQKFNRSFFLFIFFAFLSALPLGFYFFEHPQDFFGRAGQVSIFTSDNPFKELGANILKTISMFAWQGDANWRHNFAAKPQLALPFLLFFVLGLVLGFKKLTKNQFLKEKFIFAFLFVWLAIFLLPNILSAEGVPHALRSIIVLPAVMIFSAFGFIWILNKVLAWLEEKINLYPEQALRLLRIKKEIIILIFVFFIGLSVRTFDQYFLRYSIHPRTAEAFSENYLKIGKWLNTLPLEIEKYIIINAGGLLVKAPDEEHYYPMSSQTPMFITNTWSEKKQKAKNIHYFLPEEIQKISCQNKCAIVLLENDAFLREKIKEKTPSVKIDINAGFPVLSNY